MSARSELDRVHDVVDPIASDLGLEVYDIERRGATIRVTLDTPPGSEGGITLDTLALATRLISRELDHADPIPGRYVLDVSSPGIERRLRTPAHFQREVGKAVTVRLRDVEAGERRIDGVLVAADESTATIRAESGDERVIEIAAIDKARTVFQWESPPKPGGRKGGGSGAPKKGTRGSTTRDSTKEKQTS